MPDPLETLSEGSALLSAAPMFADFLENPAFSLWGAAAAAFTLGLAIWGFLLWRRNRSTLQELTESKHRISTLRQDLSRTTQELCDQKVALQKAMSSIAGETAEKKASLAALSEESELRQLLFQRSQDGIVVLTSEGLVHEANERYAEMLGYTLEEVYQLKIWDWDAQWTREELVGMLHRKSSIGTRVTTQHRRKDGSRYDVEIVSNAIDWKGQKFIVCICRDITLQRKKEHLLYEQTKTLEMISQGAPLVEILNRLLRALESQMEGVRCSVLLLDCDGKHLREGASPSLPREYISLIDGLEVGPTVGSCGTAAFCRRSIIVEDVLVDPLWEKFRDMGVRFGFRACWSSPISSPDGKVLGTLALYSNTVGRPSAHHLALAEIATHTAAICISRLLVEKALRENASRLQYALRATEDGVWDFNLVTKEMYFSPHWKLMLGYEDDELENGSETFRRLLHPEDLAPTLALTESVIRGLIDKSECVFRMRHKSGRWVDILSRAFLVRSRSGEPERLVGTHVDITQRKRTELALRALATLPASDRQETVFQGLTRQLAAAFGTQYALLVEWVDSEPSSLICLGFHSENEDKTGLAQIVAKDFCEVLFLQEGQSIPKSTLQAEPPTLDRLRQLNIEGYFGIPVVSNSQEPLGILALVDTKPLHITPELKPILHLFAERAGREIERARHISALENAEAKFRSAIENSFECLVLTNAQGICTYISPAITRILGMSPVEIIGKPSLSFLYPEDLDRLRRFKNNLLQHPGGHAEIDVRLRHADGSFRYIQSSNTNRLEDPSLRAVVSHCRDITEHKQAEAEQRRLETQLRQAQKMEAIGTLAGGIAHDFNNILGAILGCAELARLECQYNSTAIENLDALSNAARRAKELIRQILTFSRNQEPQRSVMRLEPLLEESVRLLRALLPATLHQSLRILDPIPPILGDGTLLQQVIVNLATNAAQAIGSRPGNIEIELSSVTLQKEFASAFPGLKPGLHARLSVQDDGPGIDPAILDRIFEPFFTTKGPGGGTGLGLSVVHGIVQAHEGAITVESREGQGTRFDIYLPKADQSVMPPSLKPLGTRLITTAHERILYVDDEPDLLRVNERMLRKMGYTVTACTNPFVAQEYFEKAPGDFDLVITDYSMPGQTGIDLAKHLLSKRPGIPILICTGYGAGLTRDKAYDMGFAGVLSKPFELEELCTAVRQALDAVPSRP